MYRHLSDAFTCPPTSTQRMYTSVPLQHLYTANTTQLPTRSNPFPFLSSIHTITMSDTISQALSNVKERMTLSYQTGPRLTQEPRLVAVSKTKPVSDITEAYMAGQRHFGENYMDELSVKPAQLPNDIKWHFIGHLQSNKCNQLAAIPNLYMWETCSSIKTAKAVNKALAERAPEREPLLVLVQINTSGEENKHGLSPGECLEVIRFIIDECPRLKFQGLMTIGLLGRDPMEKPNPDFKELADVRKMVCEHLGLKEVDVELSMGMSNDFEHAIEMGSTNIRVGSTIFGYRAPKQQ